MNWIVITLGTALVLALFTALLGPMFIDWTAYRATIEAHAEDFLGTRVDIGGEAEVRLLPSPRVKLTDVRLGEEERPILTTRAVEFDIDLASLLRGEFHVSDLRLDAPHATLTVEENGHLAVPDIAVDRRFASLFNADNVMVENVSVSDGALTVRDQRTGGATTLTDIEMSGEARTLRGPFKAGGTLVIGNVAQRLQLSGGTMEAGTMPVSAHIEPVAGGISANFEGAAVPRADALAVRGTLDVAAVGRNAWSIRGELRGSTSALTLSKGEVRYGAGDAALTLGADVRYTIGTREPVSLALASRQLDLDRLVRALGADTAPADAPAARPPAEWIGMLARHFAPALAALDGRGGLGVPVAASLDIGTVVAGGSIVREVSASVLADGQGLDIDRAEALLPGDTTVDLSGMLSDTFAGTVELSASQPAFLARWWTGAPLGAATMAPVVVQADLEAGPQALDARRLSLRIGDSSATGRTRFEWSGEPVLDVALAARRLSVADLKDAFAVLAATGLGPTAATDVLIDLSADEIRFGESAGAAFNLDATYRDGTLTIDALGAEDIAGAQLFASGAIGDLFGSPVGAIEGTLLASDGTRLGSALASVAGESAALGRLARALPALAPADVRFALSGGSGTSGADGLELSVIGTADGTSLDTGFSLAPGPDWRNRPARAHLLAENPDAARLLAQFGLDAIGPQAAGRVELTFEGTPSRGMTGSAEASLLGFEGRFEGDVTLTDRLAPSGSLSISAEDFTPLAVALARNIPDLAPVSLSAIVSPGENGALSLDAVEGRIAGETVAGDLTLSAAGLAGAITLPSLDLGALARLSLGTDALTTAEGDWPTTVLAEPPHVPLPLDLAVTVNSLTLGTQAFSDARFDLGVADRRLTLGAIEAGYLGGTIAGEVTLARETTRADLSGALELTDADLAALPWQEEGTPVATGRLTMEGRFASSGHTLSSLVGALGGEGTLTLSDGRLGLNPAPFDLSSLLGDTDTPPDEETTRVAVAAHLDAGDLAFDRLDGILALSGGILRLEDLVFDDTALVFEGAALDLNTFTVRNDWTLAMSPPGEDETIAVGLALEGPLAAPERRLDVAALTAWRNLRMLERQVQAVEQQNQEFEAEANRFSPVLPSETAPADTPATPPVDDEPGPAPTAPSGTDTPATPDAAAPPAGPTPPVPLPSPTSDGEGEDAAPSPPSDQRGALAPPPMRQAQVFDPSGASPW